MITYYVVMGLIHVVLGVGIFYGGFKLGRHAGIMDAHKQWSKVWDESQKHRLDSIRRERP